MTPLQQEQLRLTCILARPGRYEVIWNPESDGTAVIAGTGRPTIPLSSPVQDEIHRTFGAYAPEVGGLLLGPRNNRLVTHLLFDEHGVSEADRYVINHVSLNAALRPFRACGLNVKGIVHSHPPGRLLPTEGDRQYVERLFLKAKRTVRELFFPIWCEQRLLPFVVTAESVREPQNWALPAELILI